MKRRGRDSRRRSDKPPAQRQHGHGHGQSGQAHPRRRGERGKGPGLVAGQVVTGTLVLTHEGGKLMCRAPKGEELFLPKEELAGVRAGQELTVRVEAGRKGRLRGQVLSLGRRAPDTVVGVLLAQRRGALVEPEDGREAVFIDGESARGVADGTAVVARISKPGRGDELSRGVIEKVLGNPDDPKVQVEMLLHSQPLLREFPPAVLAEAEALPPPDPERDLVDGRRDLRATAHVTIDGADARDFDDAVYAERRGDGVRLWVSIADVAHYVREDSELDASARARGTSVYFPDRVLPMLPERLSNDLCSLRPNLPRLTQTCEATVTPDGRLHDIAIYHSLIESKARLIYEDVQKHIDKAGSAESIGPGLYASMAALLDASRWIRRRRLERGALDLDLPEAKVVMGADGVAATIRARARLEAHRLVEDLMIAANEAVAGHLIGKNLQGVFRIHEPPDPQKLAAFAAWARTQGLHLDVEGAERPKVLAQVLEKLRRHPKSEVAQSLMLRSLAQARYSPQNLGHYGLGSRAYLHFTSPIRRYPDLLVHRLLTRYARHQGPLEDLDALAEQASVREREAMEAERAMVSLHQCHVAARHVGETYEATVIGVAPHGAFVRPVGAYIEGFLSAALLGRRHNDYFELVLVEQALVARRSGVRLSVGDKVEVVLTGVNPRKRHIDFDLAGPARLGRSGPRAGRSSSPPQRSQQARRR